MIPRRYIENLTKSIDGVSAALAEELTEALLKIDFAADGAREAVKVVFATLMPAYTDSAAYLSAMFYDGIREMQIGEALGAEAISGRVTEATEIAIDGIFANGKTFDGMREQLIQRAGYEVARAAGECIFQNMKRDPVRVRYARVPSGIDTCSFCLMLASRGFVYVTNRAAGEGNHYHSHCQCRIVPSWDKNASVEGYDVKQLKQAYYDTVTYDEYGHVSSAAGKDASYWREASDNAKNSSIEKHERTLSQQRTRYHESRGRIYEGKQKWKPTK